MEAQVRPMDKVRGTKNIKRHMNKMKKHKIEAKV